MARWRSCRERIAFRFCTLMCIVFGAAALGACAGTESIPARKGDRSPEGTEEVDASEVDASLGEPPLGVQVILSVGGRGVISSIPVGLYCGNDPDQTHCRQTFKPDCDDCAPTFVELTAHAEDEWQFDGFRLHTDVPGEDYAPLPVGTDLTRAVLSLPLGTFVSSDGSVRAPLYSVIATFSPLEE